MLHDGRGCLRRRPGRRGRSTWRSCSGTSCCPRLAGSSGRSTRRSTLRTPWALTLGEDATWPPSQLSDVVRVSGPQALSAFGQTISCCDVFTASQDAKALCVGCCCSDMLCACAAMPESWMGVHGRQSALQPEWESSGSTTGLHTSSLLPVKATAATYRQDNSLSSNLCITSCAQAVAHWTLPSLPQQSQHPMPGVNSKALCHVSQDVRTYWP